MQPRVLLELCVWSLCLLVGSFVGTDAIVQANVLSNDLLRMMAYFCTSTDKT